MKISSKIPKTAPVKNAANGNHVCERERKSIFPDGFPKIPKEKLVLETDGPYLTPHPYRGTRNEPKYTNEIAQKIADILDMSKDEVETLTTLNAKKLFNF